jgi:rhodanese-related sulfurtransferase
MKFIVFPLISAFYIVTLFFAGTSHLNAADSTVIKQVSPDEAEKLIAANAGNRNFVVLDIRTPGEYRDGHFHEAVLLDFHSPTFREGLAALDKNRTYFMYCRSGNRSGRALAMMREMGFARVYELRGGILAWLSSGRELVTE